jgi:hypothetical protein
MTGRCNKSTTGVALLVLAATFVAVPDYAAKTVNAIPDVPAALDQARVIHVKGQQCFPGQKREDGQPIPPVEMDTWIDKQTGRTRQTQASTSQRSQMTSRSGTAANTTSTTITLKETICDGAYTMTLDHATKTATFARVSAYYRDLAAQRLAQGLWSQLCGQATPLEDFVKVGQETVNGTLCDTWQLDAVHTAGDGSGGLKAGGGVMRAGGRGPRGGAMGGGGNGPRGGFPGAPGYSTRTKLWLATDNGRLIRAQASSRLQGGPWELQSDYQTIECNGEIPPEVFATEPPAGYTAKNSKATAPAAQLRRGMSFNANGRTVEFGVLVAFTLSDGSVIAGWHSRERESAGTQEPLFAHLTFGGPLPKLPVEIYGLRPAGQPTGMTYLGHHLACTRKADRFTEWSLYVPTGTPPAAVRQSGCEALYRFNMTATANAQFGMIVESGVPIKTAEDFDKWVHGAMAELSDNGKVTEPLVYQKVAELSQRLRTPAKP